MGYFRRGSSAGAGELGPDGTARPSSAPALGRVALLAKGNARQKPAGKGAAWFWLCLWAKRAGAWT